MRNQVRNWRKAIADRSPSWLKNTIGPAVQYADMLFVDHGVFRLVYLNCHSVGTNAWRSAQPGPNQIGQLARLGIKTVINLRGSRICGGYWLEKEACEKYGLELVDFQVRSRAAPTKAELFGARELFKRVDYPILMHCKSGADRAGLMSTLYLISQEETPVSIAKQQLSLKFGHIRQSDTGILDYFFERYLRDTADHAMPFFQWVERVYDPDELKLSFSDKRWARFMNNTILRRE